MIAYEASCMNKFEDDLGKDFSWTEREIPVKDPEADYTHEV